MQKRKKINILGIELSLAKKSEIKNTIKDTLKGTRQIFLTTPNPEIILNTNKDEELHYIINKSDFAIPDGIGLKFASWAMGKNISRWTGSDITTWLLEYAESHQYKIAVLNWREGLSSKENIEKALRENYPELKYTVESIDREWSLGYYQKINIFQPDIIFVALGSPYQEKFIYHNISKMPYAKIAIGIGGSFDYLTGKVKPAPRIIKNIGLEWLWRILNIFSFSFVKKRLMRILNAVIIFPLKFLKWYIINPLVYRKNVACMLYKKVGHKYYVLLLERSNEADHWQILQGGRDGESLQIAGTRELQEEIGTYKFKPKMTFSNLHKYSFPDKQNKKYRNYKGQSQGLFIAEFTGDDKDIKINFWEYRSWKWVNIDDLLEFVHPVRKKSIKIYIEKFKESIINNKK